LGNAIGNRKQNSQRLEKVRVMCATAG